MIDVEHKEIFWGYHNSPNFAQSQLPNFAQSQLSNFAFALGTFLRQVHHCIVAINIVIGRHVIKHCLVAKMDSPINKPCRLQ